MKNIAQTFYFRLFSLSEVLEFSIEKNSLIKSELSNIMLSSKKLSPLKLPCTIPLSQYHQLLRKGWLNIDDSLQNTNISECFTANNPIRLEITPKFELMPQLLNLAETPEELIVQLIALSQTQPETPEELHPLLQEQNWYCSTVSQIQANGETITHHTLWHYLLPTLHSPTPESITESITHYITDQTTASLDQITQATDPLFQDIAQTFQDLFTGTLTDLENASETESTSDTTEALILLTTLTNFLDSESWPYAQLPESTAEDTTLRLSFRGENGQWPCYAKINQALQTLCFYSVSPVPATTTQRSAIAEYLTRANYGTILGNFELDYTDGEIRYKTSIDVEDDSLTPALVRNLVYTNVMMMDQYLPGLLSVLEQDVPPEQAIYLVEQTTVGVHYA